MLDDASFELANAACYTLLATCALSHGGFWSM